MLHELVEYARREGLSPEPGFKAKTIRWLLVFSPGGRFLGIHDLQGGEGAAKGREFRACPDLTDSELKSVVDGRRRRHFLVDNISVVARFTAKDEVDEDTAIKHEYFVDLLQAASNSVPALAPLVNSLRSDATRQAIHSKLIEAKAKPTESATFAVADASGATSILVENTDWHDWWRGFRADLASRLSAKKSPKRRSTKSGHQPASQFRCLLTGQMTAPASHFVIKGLRDVGGRGEDRLVSFDKRAYASYGLEGGANAAMSEQAAKAYATALEDLIKRRSHRMAGVKVVYWYSGPVERDDDPMRELLEGFGLSAPDEANGPGDSQPAPVGDRRERAQAESCARRLLEAIDSGHPPKEAAYRYYALTLSANSGRVVIRDWMEGQFDVLVSNIDRWFDCLRLQSVTGSDVVKTPGLERLLTSLLPDLKPGQNREEWMKPANTFRAALWQCALRGPSQSLMDTIARRALTQIRAAMLRGEIAEALDPQTSSRPGRLSAWYARLGLLKTYCTTIGDIDVSAYLNENHPHPAYHCGRLLATCQHIQSTAIGEPKSGVLDRFYASASTSPALVIPRIWRTALHHLKTIRGKSATLAEDLWKLLRAIHARIGDDMPRLLSLHEQSLFQLGFFHQQPFLPTHMTTRRYLTATRVSVRSKSEVIIANTLTEMGVKYGYEDEIELPDLTEPGVLPDFTIRFGDERPPIFIEHLGLLDRPSYKARWEQKLKTYADLGIGTLEQGGGPNGILVTTTEADTQDTASFRQKMESLL